MFDKYFCKKFHAKEITLVGIIIYLRCVVGLTAGWLIVSSAVCIAIALVCFKVFEQFTVATCPLKK